MSSFTGIRRFLLAIFLHSYVFTVLCFAERELQQEEFLSLADRFNITDPVFEQDGLVIRLQYGVSDVIDGAEDVEFVFYDEQCKDRDDGEDTVVVNTKGVFDISLSSKKGSVDLSIALQPDGVQNTPTIWDEEETKLTFCVRFMLFLDGIEVNYLETVITLFFDLTDGFDVEGIETKQKARTEAIASLQCEVEAFFCDTELERIPDSVNVYAQGTVFRICVQPLNVTIESGLRLKEIQSLDYWRVDQPSITQVAVKDSTAANPLSNLNCRPGLCVIETLLIAPFYLGQGVRIVKGFGIAVCELGGIGGGTESPPPDLVPPGADSTSGCRRRERRLGGLPLPYPQDITIGSSVGQYNGETSFLGHGRQMYDFSQGYLVPLDTFWNMTYPSFVEEGLKFNLSWTISDAIGDGQSEINLFNKDCTKGGPPADYLGENVLSFETYTIEGGGIGDGSQTFDATFQMNPDAVVYSDLYQQSCDGGFAQIRMCVRAQLHTPVSYGFTEVNFRESQVVLNFDLTATKLDLEFSVITNDEDTLGSFLGYSPGPSTNWAFGLSLVALMYFGRLLDDVYH